MRSGTSVIFRFGLTVIRAQGNKADSHCHLVQAVLNKALMIVNDLNGSFPLAVFIQQFDLIVFDKAPGKAESGVVVAGREKEYRRGVQSIGVAFCILSVQITVQHQADTVDKFRFLERIGDRLIGFAEITVIISPNSPIKAVQQIGAVTIVAGKLCRL